MPLVKIENRMNHTNRKTKKDKLKRLLGKQEIFLENVLREVMAELEECKSSQS